MKDEKWTQQDVKRKVKLIEDWIFDDTNSMMGSEVTGAYLSDTKHSDSKFYIASICEVYDRTTAVKHIPFLCPAR